jgi:hypothetical protein
MLERGEGQVRVKIDHGIGRILNARCNAGPWL